MEQYTSAFCAHVLGPYLVFEDHDFSSDISNRIDMHAARIRRVIGVVRNVSSSCCTSRHLSRRRRSSGWRCCGCVGLSGCVVACGGLGVIGVISARVWAVEGLNGGDVVTVELELFVVALVPGVHQRPRYIRVTQTKRVTKFVRCNAEQIRS